MKNEEKVKENQVDLTKITAPCIYLKSIIEGNHGDKIYKYHLRLKQPNQEFFTQEEIKELEECLEKNLAQYLVGVVSIAPLGSFTGFSVCVLNNPSVHSIKEAIDKTVHAIAESTGVNVEFGFAKKYAAKLLESEHDWLVAM